MAAVDVQIIAIFNDNYSYILHSSDDQFTIAIDPADPRRVANAIDERQGKLDIILNTHHHDDHISGNKLLKARYSSKIIGPEADRPRISDLDSGVNDGDVLSLGGMTVQVIATPGHTLGHVAFYVPEAEALFAGDTLFSLGCGRLFEGTAAQMWSSLRKLRALPGGTQLYCGHEYTASNAAFALSIDPNNTALQSRAAEIQSLRSRGRPTVPVSLAIERATNPFLRADDADLAAEIGMTGAEPADVFAELRQRKDRY